MKIKITSRNGEIEIVEVEVIEDGKNIALHKSYTNKKRFSLTYKKSGYKIMEIQYKNKSAIDRAGSLLKEMDPLFKGDFTSFSGDKKHILFSQLFTLFAKHFSHEEKMITSKKDPNNLMRALEISAKLK